MKRFKLFCSKVVSHKTKKRSGTQQHTKRIRQHTKRIRLLQHLPHRLVTPKLFSKNILVRNLFLHRGVDSCFEREVESGVLRCGRQQHTNSIQNAYKKHTALELTFSRFLANQQKSSRKKFVLITIDKTILPAHINVAARAGHRFRVLGNPLHTYLSAGNLLAETARHPRGLLRNTRVPRHLYCVCSVRMARCFFFSPSPMKQL